MPLAPPIIAEAESETSGTIIVPEGRKRSRPSAFPAPSHMLAGTRAGIELGRPVYAVAAIGAAIALGAWLLAGANGGAGAAIGAGTATLNLWMFTRIGRGFVSRRGLQASWGVLAALKLLVLFGGVATLLKLELADPIAFVVGYLALPIGIVASQLLGLQPDFEES
jgi:ABC-type Co2+ transport system permease subunit